VTLTFDLCAIVSRVLCVLLERSPKHVAWAIIKKVDPFHIINGRTAPETVPAVQLRSDSFYYTSVTSDEKSELYLANGCRSSGIRRSAGLLTGGGMLVRTMSGSGTLSTCDDSSGIVNICDEFCCDCVCVTVLVSLLCMPAGASSPLWSHYIIHDVQCTRSHTLYSTTSSSYTMSIYNILTLVI